MSIGSKLSLIVFLWESLTVTKPGRAIDFPFILAYTEINWRRYRYASVFLKIEYYV